MKKSQYCLERDIFTIVIIETNVNYKGENLPLNLPLDVKIAEKYKGIFQLYGFMKIENKEEFFQLFLNEKWGGNYFNEKINLPYSFLINKDNNIKFLSKQNFKIGLMGYIRIDNRE